VSDLPHHSAFIARFRRLCAAGAAVLVLLLTALAVSPALHSWLHNDSVVDDDGCAVVLFANGVALAAGPIAVTPPAQAWEPAPAPATAEIFLVPARYLRQPERGPPVA
jgi:hypothetical protein